MATKKKTTTSKTSEVVFGTNLSPFVTEDFYQSLGTATAPTDLKGIQPVSVINFGYPKPNSRQVVRVASFRPTAPVAETTYSQTLATESALINVYYLGYSISGMNGTVYVKMNDNVDLANTWYYDNEAMLDFGIVNTGTTRNILQVPLKVKSLSARFGVYAAVVGRINVFWIEESK